MDPMEARLVEEGAKFVGFLLKVAVTRPRKPSTETTEEPAESPKSAAAYQASVVSLPTSDETTTELKRRLYRELYKAELDLAGGLLIAGKPCTCLENKHPLLLEAAAEELISEDPNNTVYLDIIQWIKVNQPKVNVEAIQSGAYTAEYPHMANEFKNFRKRVMGSVGTTESPGANITLEQAKKMAAEEASSEVERQWPSQETK